MGDGDAIDEDKIVLCCAGCCFHMGLYTGGDCCGCTGKVGLCCLNCEVCCQPGKNRTSGLSWQLALFDAGLILTLICRVMIYTCLMSHYHHLNPCCCFLSILLLWTMHSFIQVPNVFPAFAVDLILNVTAWLVSRPDSMPVAVPLLPPFPVTKKSQLLLLLLDWPSTPRLDAACPSRKPWAVSKSTIRRFQCVRMKELM